MGKLFYSPLALQDMDGIWNYIFEELSNPTAASNTVNRILDHIDRLRQFPEIGSPFSSVAKIETDYRYLVYGNYLAFYRSQGEDIYIDRVLYGRRDYLKILFGELPEENV